MVVGDTVVGHMPRDISTAFYFLQQGGLITCEVTGRRKPLDVLNKGLIVPCNYMFHGRTNMIKKLQALRLGGFWGSSEPLRFDPRSCGSRLIMINYCSRKSSLHVHISKAPGAMNIVVYVMCGLCPCYSTCTWLQCTYTLTCVAGCNPSTVPK